MSEKSPLNNLIDKLFDGKKSFFTTFITSWMIWNWRVLIILIFSKASSNVGYAINVIQAIEPLISVDNDLKYPFLIAMARHLIIQRLIERLNKCSLTDFGEERITGLLFILMIIVLIYQNTFFIIPKSLLKMSEGMIVLLVILLILFIIEICYNAKKYIRENPKENDKNTAKKN